jgi:hypothetical protein
MKIVITHIAPVNKAYKYSTITDRVGNAILPDLTGVVYNWLGVAEKRIYGGLQLQLRPSAYGF